jgi:hypothetical protein
VWPTAATEVGEAEKRRPRSLHALAMTAWRREGEANQLLLIGKRRRGESTPRHGLG